MRDDRVSGLHRKILTWVREDSFRSSILVLFFANALLGLFAYINTGKYDGPLYPVPPPEPEIFNDYPTAEYLHQRGSTINGSLYLSSETNDQLSELFEYKLTFETDDPPSDVLAYYNALAARSGWHPVDVRDYERHRYHFGDFERSIYNYYLYVFATALDDSDPYWHLSTYVSIRIERTLPIYPKAINLIANKTCGIDDCDWTVEFSSQDSPHKILAFYKEILPTSIFSGKVWAPNSTWSHATQLYWKLGRTSYAEVNTSQESGLTHVKVKVYHGCCGGLLREHSLHSLRSLDSY
ncbi:MAG: hypothetical protein WCD37_20455 [Chloroflexia bacterium]